MHGDSRLLLIHLYHGHIKIWKYNTCKQYLREGDRVDGGCAHWEDDKRSRLSSMVWQTGCRELEQG